MGIYLLYRCFDLITIIVFASKLLYSTIFIKNLLQCKSFGVGVHQGDLVPLLLDFLGVNQDVSLHSSFFLFLVLVYSKVFLCPYILHALVLVV